MGATPELGTANKRQSQDFPIPLSHSHILDWSTVTSAQPARDGQAGVRGPGHRSDPDFRQRKSPQGTLRLWRSRPPTGSSCAQLQLR